MKIYKLKNYQQALILACKGHNRSEVYDNTIDSIKPLVAKIIGSEEQCITDNIISYWLYETYEKLLEIDETCFKVRNSLKDFMTNKYEFYDSNINDFSFDQRVIKFLISEILTVQVYDKDVFRIELNEGREYLGLELKGE